MGRRLRVRPKALLDIAAAVRWYEHERAGLGAEFLADAEVTFPRICEAPLRYAQVLGATRRALLDRFPYAIFFRADTTTVDVVAVFHTSRDPRTWAVREPAILYQEIGIRRRVA